MSARGGLPEYTLRVSDRARHVRLMISPHEGLVVVVPRRMRNRSVDSILRERRTWIERVSARFAERRALIVAGAEALLPDQVAFAATGERWPVEYRHGAGASARAHLSGSLLVVSGPVDDADACLAALVRWLQVAAKERLLPMLAEESCRRELPYSVATIRGQRTRWGSCSHNRTISLNRCLLFLSPELVRSVMVHELAHLAHPNHSAGFWSYLETLDPLARRHRRAMKEAWDAIPPWAEPGSQLPA